MSKSSRRASMSELPRLAALSPTCSPRAIVKRIAKPALEKICSPMLEVSAVIHFPGHQGSSPSLTACRTVSPPPMARRAPNPTTEKLSSAIDSSDAEDPANSILPSKVEEAFKRCWRRSSNPSSASDPPSTAPSSIIERSADGKLAIFRSPTTSPRAVARKAARPAVEKLSSEIDAPPPAVADGGGERLSAAPPLGRRGSIHSCDGGRSIGASLSPSSHSLNYSAAGDSDGVAAPPLPSCRSGSVAALGSEGAAGGPHGRQDPRRSLSASYRRPARSPTASDDPAAAERAASRPEDPSAVLDALASDSEAGGDWARTTPPRPEGGLRGPVSCAGGDARPSSRGRAGTADRPAAAARCRVRVPDPFPAWFYAARKTRPFKVSTRDPPWRKTIRRVACWHKAKSTASAHTATSKSGPDRRNSLL